MSNSYTRQSSFSNGDVIDASLFNAEYDQLVLAFSQTVGHTHNGTAGEGAYVPLISDPTAVTKVVVDTTVTDNHKITFTLDGVAVLTIDETDGFTLAGVMNMPVEDLSNVNAPVADGYFRWNGAADTVEFLATIAVADVIGLATVATSGDANDLSNLHAIGLSGDLKDTNEIGTPVNNGFFRWDATTAAIVYSATIAHTDLTGLDSVNFTHDSQNMDTYLDELDARTVDAAADAAAAAVSAALADADRIDAETAAAAAIAAAAVVGVPVYIADAGTHVINNADVFADIVFEGDGTLTLPTTLVKGRRFRVRLSFKAVSTKIINIATPTFTIVAAGVTLVPGDTLTLAPGDRVTLEIISTTELEII